jgi:cysteinyl-tRNA synthetase
MGLKNIFFSTVLTVLLGLGLGSCALFSDTVGESSPKTASPSETIGPGNVESWAYWLQNIRIKDLRGTPFDLVVIDYSRDGSNRGAFSAPEIEALQKEGKTVLAYFSIGEAEEYRFYWKKAWKTGDPSFIGPENPEWPGNYKVRYWDPRWWNTVLRPYLDRIIRAGFDGVYLDLIDSYYYWGEREGGADAMRLYADRMISLILQITEYGRSKLGENFVVCIQNGLAVLSESSPDRADALLSALSYAAVESLFYNTTPAVREIRMTLLELVHQAGIPILNVEYIPPRKRKEYNALLEKAPVPITGFAADADRLLDHPPDVLPKK